MLFAALDAGGDLGFLQRRPEGLGDLADEFLLIARARFNSAREPCSGRGTARGSQVLEFELDRVQPQPFGDRRVDFQVSRALRRRFTGGITPRVRMLCMRSASLTMMTRMSRTIASSIFRKLSPAPPGGS